jgi:hypothetical protein
MIAQTVYYEQRRGKERESVEQGLDGAQGDLSHILSGHH